MKILRVVNNLYPTEIGGTGLHAHELSKAQARLGHDVTVITSKLDDSPAYEERDDYHIFRIKPLVSPFGNNIMPSLLPELVKRHGDCDIIHAHSHLLFASNLCAVFRHISSAPLIITNHGLVSQTAPPWVQKLYMPTAAKLTYRAADGVICYTDYEKSKLIDLGICANKIAVIHNGIDTGVFRGAPFSDRGKTLLWIGRYAPGKGVDYLLDAFQRFLKDHPGYTLLMIGNGPEKEAAQSKIRDLGLAEFIVMKDFIPNHELPEVYRSACAFILPSLNEGVPRAILEAMACGTPVICTELPQLVDIVEGAGLLVPVRDSQAIADALDRLVSDMDYASCLGQIGLKRVQERYDWSDTVRRTILLYDHILGSLGAKDSPPFTPGEALTNAGAETTSSVEVGEAKGNTWDG